MRASKSRVLMDLFMKMADQVDDDGELSVSSVGPAGSLRVRYTYEGHNCPVSTFFKISIPAGPAGDLGLVEIKAPRCPPVLMSPIPSAVLAVALR